MNRFRSVVQDEADVVRFVRFAPWHLWKPGRDVDDWIAKNVPRGFGPTARYISRSPHAEAWNARYARTLDAMGAARFRRREAMDLLHELVRQGDMAVSWKRSGEADRFDNERRDEDLFFRQRPTAIKAADALARAFRNTSHAAQRASALAFLKGMEQVPLPSELQVEGQRVETGIASPFQHWRAPLSAPNGDAQPSDHLVALMERLAMELRDEKPGGHHTRRVGPFYFPSPGATPRDSHDILTTGLIFIAVRGAKVVSGGAKGFVADAPLPEAGKARYGLAVAYVRDVTAAAHPRGRGTELTQVQVRDRLREFRRRYPKALCRGWAGLSITGG